MNKSTNMILVGLYTHTHTHTYYNETNEILVVSIVVHINKRQIILYEKPKMKHLCNLFEIDNLDQIISH